MHAPLSANDGGRAAGSETEIAGILRGDIRHPVDPDAFVRAAARHAVGPLLVYAGVARRLPDPARVSLLAEARQQIARTLTRERELRRVLAALDREGVRVLVIKGAHLSATCYAESWLRLRDDTDLLVHPADRARACAVLEALGYRAQSSQTGPAVLGQTLFDRPGAIGAALDVHWRIAAPPVAAAVFDADDLLSRAVAVPRLGPVARGPSRVDALAIACLHQAAHHPGSDLMLWTYDLHLLMERFTPADSRQFLDLAVSRRVVAICAAGIGLACERFRGTVAAGLLARLEASGAREPSAILLQPTGRLRGIARDLRALDTWGDRRRLAAAHLFPPAAYMRDAFAPASRAPLAWLYLRRLLRAGRRHSTPPAPPQ